MTSHHRKAWIRGAVAVTTALIATLLTAPTSVAGGGISGDVELVSIDTGEGGGRELPAMSADGSRVVFVGRGENQGVWIRDRSGGTSHRLTTGSHFNPAISNDGDTVAFAQYGTNRSVFVIDVTDPSSPGTPILVSKNENGTSANALSDFPSLSEDGRFVAFQSTGSNLDPATPLPSSGGPTKVYVHDRDVSNDGTFDQAGDIDTFMVSVTAAGVAPPGNAVKPDLTPDGSVVVFGSEQVLDGASPSSETAGTAAEEEEEDTAAQVWKASISAGDVTDVALMSHAPDGSPGDLGSALAYGPSVSDDGSVVGFDSEATNLVVDDTNDDVDAFVETSGTVTRVSVDGRTATKGDQLDLEPQAVVPCTGEPWTDETGAEIVPVPVVGAGPVVAGDGTFVAFESDAALTADDLNATQDEFGTVRITDVYGYDIATGQVERLSQPLPEGIEATGCRPEGSTGAISPMNNGTDPAIGGDRSFVAFVSNGDLAAERPEPIEPANADPAVHEEEEEGEEPSTEPAVHGRTYGPLALGMFVRDATVIEHDTGTTTVEVLVGLTGFATSEVTVDYATVDATASEGGDYEPTTGSLTFAVGEISKLVEVEVVGDLANEGDEDFLVNLSNASIIVGDPVGEITIADDDDVARFNDHYRSVAMNVLGDFVPLVGDFDASGVYDVFWYADGTAKDYLWTDVTANGSLGVGSVTLPQVNGTYAPFVYDFDGDGFDDVFWYRAGTGQDYVWFGGAAGFTSRAVTVNGTYVPVATKADNGKSAVLWYAAGSAGDFLWIGEANRTFTSVPVRQISGTYRPVAFADSNHEPGILFHAPGPATDWVWGGIPAAGGNPAVNQAVSINGDYQPLPQYPAALLYGPGSASDVAVGYDLFGPGFSSLPASISGVYETGASPEAGLIVWHRPGSGTDYFWVLID